jgi:HSP20 family molecular chaperone IbpA
MNDQAPTHAPTPAPTAEPANSGGMPTLVPPTDIFETKDAVIMLLDVPGADPDSLDVTLDKRELTIAARTMATSPQGCALVYAEYEFGNYERSFTLSDEIDGERIDAAFKDGVLRLNLPKISPAPAKKIAVKPV